MKPLKVLLTIIVFLGFSSGINALTLTSTGTLPAGTQVQCVYSRMPAMQSFLTNLSFSQMESHVTKAICQDLSFGGSYYRLESLKFTCMGMTTIISNPALNQSSSGAYFPGSTWAVQVWHDGSGNFTFQIGQFIL